MDFQSFYYIRPSNFLVLRVLDYKVRITNLGTVKVTIFVICKLRYVYICYFIIVEYAILFFMGRILKKIGKRII